MRILIAIGIVVAAFAGTLVVRHWLNMPLENVPLAITEKPCNRIICLSPGLTETVFALGLGSKVVGVTRFCLYPPEAKNCPDIGGFLDPNYEAIVALRPDIVFLTPYQRELMRDLQRLGVNTCTVLQDSLADILNSYKQIGALCNCREAADVLSSELNACLDRLKRRTPNMPTVRLLLTTGRDIRTGKLNEVYAVGRGTFLDELVTLLGCENIAPGNLLEYPAVSVEGILHLDPDIIIELVADMEYDAVMETNALQAWKSLPDLRAARENKVHVLFGNYLTIPGPRGFDP